MKTNICNKNKSGNNILHELLNRQHELKIVVL